MINSAINKLLSKNDLESTIIYEVFEEILSGIATPIQTSSFLTALKTKPETLEELFYSIDASRGFVKKINLPYSCDNLIENITMNEDSSIIDISFAVDIICSANNLGVLKYSFNMDKAFQTLSFFSENFFNKTLNNFERLCFGYFLLDKNEPYYKYSSIVDKNLTFDNIFSIIDKFLNPYGAKNQVIGVNRGELVEKIALLCLKLKNSNSLVMSAKNNFPYISLESETYVAEAWKDKIFTYTLTPELLGFKNHSIDEIKCDNISHSALIIKDVFENKTKNASYCAIVLNSAMALYIAKKAPSIIDGIELAKKTIDSNLAIEKLEQIIKSYSN